MRTVFGPFLAQDPHDFHARTHILLLLERYHKKAYYIPPHAKEI